MSTASAQWLDHSAPVRQGEELDAARLEAFLKARVPGLSGSIAIEQFPKGYSNLTYLIRVGERELVLRRPPVGAKIKTAHDMSREYRILSHIHSAYPKAPQPIAYCEDESVLGACFYVMEKVQGIILRSAPPPGLELDAPLMRQLSESFIQNLTQLHALDYVAAGLADLGKPEGYVGRQIEGWTRRYQNARTDDIADMDRVVAWLREHEPPESGSCLIHNDFKYDNLVLEAPSLGVPASPPASTRAEQLAGEDAGAHRLAGLRIRAVLDWEMATIGDPLMDVGSTLGYWVDPDDPDEWQQQAFGVTTRPGNLNREDLLQRYADLTGRHIGNSVFYYAYGLFKIAVIVQQIYARFKQGWTQDQRFGRLIDMVRAASLTAALAIEKKRIGGLASM